MRLRNFFDTGWYALDWDYAGDGPGGDGTNTFVYAPVTMLLLHGWSVLWGVEGWGRSRPPRTPTTCATSASSLIGLVGLAAVAAIGRVLLRQLALGAGRRGRASPRSRCGPGTRWSTSRTSRSRPATRWSTLGLLLFVRTRAPRPGAAGRPRRLPAGGPGAHPRHPPGDVAGLLVAGRGRGASGVLDRRRTSRAWSPSPSSPPPAPSPPAPWSRSTRTCTAHRCARSRGPPRRPPASSTARADRLVRAAAPRRGDADAAAALRAHRRRSSGVVLLLRATARRPGAAPAGSPLVGVQAAAMPVVAIVMGSDLYHGLRQLLFALPASRCWRRTGWPGGCSARDGATSAARHRPWPPPRWSSRSSTRSPCSRTRPPTSTSPPTWSPDRTRRGRAVPAATSGGSASRS